MGFADTLKKLDIFGGQRGLTFSGEERHKTLVGSFLTILYLLFVVFFMVYYADSFATRHENPVINSKKLITDISPRLDFRKNKFFFTIGLLYRGVYVKPTEIEKILNITIEQKTSFIDDQSSLRFKSDMYKMRSCIREDFVINKRMIIQNPDRSPSIFSLCLDNKASSLNIDGEFHTEGKKFIRVTVSPCEGNMCRVDLGTILASESLKMVMGMIEVSINQNNFTYPYNYHYNSDREFSFFNSKTYVRKLFFEKSIIETDEGIFIKDPTIKPSMNFKEEMNQDKDRSKSSEPFVELNLYSSNDIFKISRDYDKFQDMLAKIGGMVSITTLVMGLLYKFYNKISLKLDIMNKALLSGHGFKTGSEKEDVEQPAINFCQVIKFIFVKICSLFGCKCFSEKTKTLTTMYFNADERVHDYLEVKAIVNNTRDVRLLRRIFFNKYQAHLLEKIENDTLMVDSEHHYLDEEKKRVSDEDAVKYIEKHQDADDDVDRRINSFFAQLNNKIEIEKKKVIQARSTSKKANPEDNEKAGLVGGKVKVKAKDENLKLAPSKEKKKSLEGSSDSEDDENQAKNRKKEAKNKGPDLSFTGSKP